jgi:hypothetical protein
VWHVYMYIVYYGWKESEMKDSMRIVGGMVAMQGGMKWVVSGQLSYEVW